MSRTNEERAASAYAALLVDQTDNCYGDAKQAEVEITESPVSAIADLLANLRHYCDQEGLNFGEIDSLAYDHYTEEVDEELRARRANGGRGNR